MKKYLVPLDVVGGPNEGPNGNKNNKIENIQEAEKVYLEKCYRVLKGVYHYDEFRGKQKEVILTTLSGRFDYIIIIIMIIITSSFLIDCNRDSFVLMPTGIVILLLGKD